MQAACVPGLAELAYAAGCLHHSELTMQSSSPAVQRVRHYLMSAAGVRLEQPAGFLIAPPSAGDFEAAQHWLERAAEERRGDGDMLHLVMDHLARMQQVTRLRELEEQRARRRRRA